MAVLGARTCGASHENAALELLSSVARPESAAWHIIHCTNRCNMWLLGASAAEEVAEKAALISIDVPADYKWVLLALVGVFFANQYLVVGVMQARKKYGIKYPNLYAPPGHKNEEAFNCAQRAHQNTVESQALFLVELVVVGLFYPLFVATCGALYSVGRILYGYGYATKGPDGRLIGSLISHLGDLPLQIAVFKLCYVAFTTW